MRVLRILQHHWEEVMRKLSKRETEIIALMEQGLSPKSHCGNAVRRTGDNIQASGEYPQSPERAELV
jgi:DNA-binding CsgD family transcriptional regulator